MSTQKPASPRSLKRLVLPGCAVAYLAGWMLTTAWRYQRPEPVDGASGSGIIAFHVGMVWPVYWSYLAAEKLTEPRQNAEMRDGQ